MDKPVGMIECPSKFAGMIGVFGNSCASTEGGCPCVLGGIMVTPEIDAALTPEERGDVEGQLSQFMNRFLMLLADKGIKPMYPPTNPEWVIGAPHWDRKFRE